MSISFFPDSTPVDPNLFAVSWEALFEVLILVVIVSIVVERVLALVFESDAFIQAHKRRKKAGKGSFKPLIAFIVSAVVCLLWQVDLMAVLLTHGHYSVFGTLITAAVVAGGSKGSIKLFRDVLGIKSNAYKEYEEAKKTA